MASSQVRVPPNPSGKMKSNTLETLLWTIVRYHGSNIYLRTSDFIDPNRFVSVFRLFVFLGLVMTTAPALAQMNWVVGCRQLPKAASFIEFAGKER